MPTRTILHKNILQLIKNKYPYVKLVIQIARGRSAEPTYNEIIKPILDKIRITNVILKYGYRRRDYYEPEDDTPFVFFNYGMFGELSDNIKVKVGEICNPVITYDILNYDSEKGFEFVEKEEIFEDNLNILNSFNDIKKIILFGIADEMEFVTPDIYKKIDIYKIINSI